MASLGGSMGEGGGAGRQGKEFTDTGYGTHTGAGNVEDESVRHQEGTGWDPATGQVKTRFGSYAVGYDPVTGAATDATTMGYTFPEQAVDPLAGGLHALDRGPLADISAAAPGHTTRVNPDLEAELDEFFVRHPQPPPPAAVERTGQGVTERLEHGEYLEERPTRTGEEAEAWHRSPLAPPRDEEQQLERPGAHLRRRAARHGQGEDAAER